MILEFAKLSPELQKTYLEKMRHTGWESADYLCELIDQNATEEIFGKDAKILLYTIENDLAAFCTYGEKDEIDNPNQKPWVGFVFTYPEYRGNRISGHLIEHAVMLAKAEGYKKIYVSSEEVGLYEKYGFRFLCRAESIHEYETQIFVRDL